MTQLIKTTSTTIATTEKNVTRAVMNAANKIGEGIEAVHRFAMHYHNPLKEDPGAVEKLLELLPTIAATYGARQEVDGLVYDAAVEFVLENFGFLAVEEVADAYKMNATGKLSDRAEMYGKFSLDQIGKVLSMYADHRKKFVGAYLFELESIREFEMQVEKETSKRVKFETIFRQQIENAKANFVSWEEVPEYWYQELTRRGAIKLTKEQGQEYYKKAQHIAENVINQREKAKLLLPWEQRFKEFSDIAADDYAKIVARKLVVFDNLQTVTL
jgi:hypothetical protein